MFLTQ